MIDERCLHLAGWIRHQGWLELGQDEFSSSFIRVLDPGGMGRSRFVSSPIMTGSDDQ